MRKSFFLIGIACLLLTFAEARSDVLFSDNFNSGASSAWGNEAGNWTANGGVYRAQSPNNFPNTHSFVTTFPSLTDFSVSTIVVSGRDGGIWLRAAADPTSSVGVTGILLIFLNDGIHDNTLFWHQVTTANGGNPYGAELNTASNLPLGNFLLRIDVQGNTYSAYLNGSNTPATTFTSSLFTSGYTGVYDHDIFNNGAQAFDNFSLNSLPPLFRSLPLVQG